MLKRTFYFKFLYKMHKNNGDSWVSGDVNHFNSICSESVSSINRELHPEDVNLSSHLVTVCPLNTKCGWEIRVGSSETPTFWMKLEKQTGVCLLGSLNPFFLIICPWAVDGRTDGEVRREELTPFRLMADENLWTWLPPAMSHQLKASLWNRRIAFHGCQRSQRLESRSKSTRRRRRTCVFGLNSASTPVFPQEPFRIQHASAASRVFNQPTTDSFVRRRRETFHQVRTTNSEKSPGTLSNMISLT